MAHDHTTTDASNASNVVMDAWFQHGPNAKPPQQERGSHVNPLQLGVFFGLLTFGVVATIVVVAMYFTSYMTTVRAEKMETTEPAQAWYEMRAASEQRMDTGGALGIAAQTVVQTYADLPAGN